MLLLTVASTMQADNKSDSDYIRKLIGEWQQTIKIGPMSVMTDYSYKKDGTLEMSSRPCPFQIYYSDKWPITVPQLQCGWGWGKCAPGMEWIQTVSRI